jgi:aminoacyl tRNA synthase complex-interacting multifunctional protein 1
LLRWYDHIHAVADTLNLFPAAKIQKTNFAPPPPLAPAPAKPGKAASVPSADNGGKKKEPSTANGPAPSAPAAANEAAGESTNESKKKDAKKKDTTLAAAPATPATSTSNNENPSARSSGPTIDVLDIRIGRIVGVKPHPNADSLYVEDIDLGEEQPRQVVSGLRKFVPLEAMQGRRVVVVCNLKPAKMRDVMSYGMVLCASNSDHTQVDPILPPEGAAVGERVKFEGYNAEPDAQINPKKKIMEKVGPDLVTDAGTIGFMDILAHYQRAVVAKKIAHASLLFFCFHAYKIPFKYQTTYYMSIISRPLMQIKFHART